MMLSEVGKNIVLPYLTLSKNYIIIQPGESSEGYPPLTKKCGFRGRVPQKPLL